MTIANMIAILIFGPLATFGFGFYEISAFYALIVLLPAKPLYYFAFHLAFGCLSILFIPVSLRLRKYRRAGAKEVVGRFQKQKSVWPY